MKRLENHFNEIAKVSIAAIFIGIILWGAIRASQIRVAQETKRNNEAIREWIYAYQGDSLSEGKRPQGGY